MDLPNWVAVGAVAGFELRFHYGRHVRGVARRWFGRDPVAEHSRDAVEKLLFPVQVEGLVAVRRLVQQHHVAF